ncbi:hypothetical protein C3454_18550 [Citrobacter europaeus]|nr:hypothetical protein MC47_001135 [Citrobacter freundii]ROW34795.1 hypothetical protein C3454_18550 [Citrobacter europaeus]
MMTCIYGKHNLSSTGGKRMSMKIFRSAGEPTYLRWYASITVVQKQPISSKVCRTSHFLPYADGFTSGSSATSPVCLPSSVPCQPWR